MKNYLFTPFNDEGEKIEGFNAIRDYLPKKYRHPLVMFMAKLESTYDVIISKLESDNSLFHGQSEERKEHSLLKYDEIRELKAEIKELKADNNKHYPKEYQAEARDYFNHNPNSEKLWFFMVGDSEVDEDGDVRKTFNVGVDAIAECDNFNGDISTEVYR